MKHFFQIKINSIHKQTLTLYITFLQKLFQKANIGYTTVCLPTTIKRITLLKSPHVYKKAREQFELHTYRAILNVLSKIDANFLRILIINKPKNLKLKIKKD